MPISPQRFPFYLQGLGWKRAVYSRRSFVCNLPLAGVIRPSRTNLMNRFQPSLGSKVLAGVVTLLFVSWAFVFFSIHKSNQIHDTTRRELSALSATHALGLNLLHQTELMTIAARQWLLVPTGRDRTEAEDAIQRAIAESEATIQELRSGSPSSASSKDSALDLRSLVSTDSALTLEHPLATLSAETAATEAAFRSYAEAIRTLLSTPRAINDSTPVAALTKHQAALDTSLHTLITATNRGTSQTYAERRFRQHQTLHDLLVIGLLLSLTTVCLFWFGWKRTALTPLRVIVTKLREVGKGDLRQDFSTTRTDELGMLSSALGQMLGELSAQTVSRSYVDNILQSMADALIVISADGAILKANAAAVRLLQYSDAKLLTLRLDDIAKGVNQSVAISSAEQEELLARGSIQDREKFFYAADKTKIPVLFSASLMRNKDGEIEGIVCLAQDTREQKRAHNTLIELRTAFELAGIGSSRLSPEGLYQQVDTVYAGLLGYTPDELIGQNWRKTVLIEDISIAEAAYQSLLISGRQDFNARALRKDGSVFYKHVVMVLARDESGTPAGHYCFMSDIDDQQRAYVELERARDSAIRAARTKTEFLANMSHEIRTPMNGVLGMTDLLLETGLSAEQQDLAQTAKSSAESLLKIINDVLDFSKLESGKFTLEVAPFNGREWFDRMLSMMQVHARRKGQELIGNFEHRIPKLLLGDHHRLQQVLVNLIGNAIKFTPASGGVLVLARLEEESQNSATIHFTVSDSGVGIPADKREAIFEAFVQADCSTTRQYGGTGLGLSITRELVNLMQGGIWVESALGVGSTFHVVIPFGLVRHLQSTDEEMLAIERRMERLLQLKVAIIDPNPGNANNLVRLLGSWGMQPTSFTSWEDGLETLRRSRAQFDLVIVNVPTKEPGWIKEATAQVSDSNEEAPCLFLLPKEERVEIGATAETRSAQFLHRPATYSMILDSILRMVDTRPTASTTHLPQELPEGSAQPGSEPLNGLRVLLAEDNAVNQKLATALLQKHGVTVTVVSTGLAAIDALEREPFELVLMDIQMPEMSGDAAIREIRGRSAAYAKVPIIALTAHAMLGDRERYLSMGANDYVSKPIKREDLLAAISRVRGEVVQRRE